MSSLIPPVEQEKDGSRIRNSCSSVSECCPICLSPILEESYLDQCLHKFCYKCILQWTKVVASKHSSSSSSSYSPPSTVKCPLCKRASSSIIYGYDGSSFHQHLLSQNLGDFAFFTKAHKYRFQCYYVEPGKPIGGINVSRYFKSGKYRQQNEWLYSWLRREIQALIQEEDVDIVVHHILGVIDSWRRNDPKYSKVPPETKQEDFGMFVAQAARPFLTGRTDRFVDELEMFLASGLNIVAYDKVYLSHLGWKIPEISAEDKEEEVHECTPTMPVLSFLDEDLDDKI